LNFGDNNITTPQAQIQVVRDATSSNNTDMPTAINFSTTPDGSATLTERMRIMNSGNVGIGTTAPAAGLHVIKTTGGVSANWYDPANYAGTFHQDLNAIQHYGLLVSDRWRSSENFVFAVDGRFTNGGGTVPEDTHNPYLIVRGDGNVGIGTMSPGALLDVNGDITAHADAGGQAFRAVGRSGDNFAWAPLAFQNDGSTYTGGMNYTPSAVNLNAGSALASVMSWLPSGNVITPNKTAFVAKICSSTINAGSFIVWETVETNIGSNYNNTNGLFTAPVSGMYVFGFNLLEQMADSGEYRFEFWKNGGIYDGIIQQKNAGQWLTTQSTITVYLNAGDTMGIYYSMGTGAVYIDCNYNRFWGYLIG
jgi:hypothetical protein